MLVRDEPPRIQRVEPQNPTTGVFPTFSVFFKQLLEGKQRPRFLSKEATEIAQEALNKYLATIEYHDTFTRESTERNILVHAANELSACVEHEIDQWVAGLPSAGPSLPTITQETGYVSVSKTSGFPDMDDYGESSSRKGDKNLSNDSTNHQRKNVCIFWEHNPRKKYNSKKLNCRREMTVREQRWRQPHCCEFGTPVLTKGRRLHMRHHIKPYYCTQCWYRSANSKEFKAHINVRCDMANRNTRFEQRSQAECERNKKLMTRNITLNCMKKLLFEPCIDPNCCETTKEFKGPPLAENEVFEARSSYSASSLVPSGCRAARSSGVSDFTSNLWERDYSASSSSYQSQMQQQTLKDVGFNKRQDHADNSSTLKISQPLIGFSSYSDPKKEEATRLKSADSRISRSEYEVRNSFIHNEESMRCLPPIDEIASSIRTIEQSFDMGDISANRQKMKKYTRNRKAPTMEQKLQESISSLGSLSLRPEKRLKDSAKQNPDGSSCSSSDVLSEYVYCFTKDEKCLVDKDLNVLDANEYDGVRGNDEIEQVDGYTDGDDDDEDEDEGEDYPYDEQEWLESGYGYGYDTIRPNGDVENSVIEAMNSPLYASIMA
ncbi:hypothetical protein EDC01DRAFT_744532 [Geopyxis carbonaria]|nr:hypothetical protein EDC01DRAFT_744532 [Geopyxis carbonaria]